MMKKVMIERMIKEGFLMGTAEKKRALQAELQQLEQMGEEVPDEMYNKILGILNTR